MSKKEYQCLNNNCLKIFNTKIKKCPICGGIDINELVPAKCDQCGYQDKDTEIRTIYFGPDGNYCSECVPRESCSCNTFFSKEEGLRYNSEQYLKEMDGYWIVVDDKGRLCPCVDYC